MKIRIPSSYVKIAMDAVKRIPLIKGHLVASSLDRPYVRLCADVAVEHPFTYEVVRVTAFSDKGDAAFMLGGYEDEIRPYIETHLRHNRFPYSLLEIDGVKQNRTTNVALWLSKPELKKLEPIDYARCIANFSMVEVFEEVSGWEELEPVLNRLVLLQVKDECSSFGRETPVFFRTVYEFGVGNLGLYPKPYRAMPPTVWHFYGKPAPEEFLILGKEIRRNPKNFGGSINEVERSMRRR